MGLFDWLKKKRHDEIQITVEIQDSVEEKPTTESTKYDDLVLSETDFLGKAAKAKNEALDAIKAKKYDKAWGLLHDVKTNYLQHANRSEFSTRDTIRLDATVHEHFANILRIEAKHRDAFVHILYWIAANDRMTKNQQNKLSSYFNRAKFQNVDKLEIIQLIESQHPIPDYREIQTAVRGWGRREEGQNPS